MGLMEVPKITSSTDTRIYVAVVDSDHLILMNLKTILAVQV